MRTPTDQAHTSQWWRDALAGLSPPIHADEPQPGFYKRRIVKGGPWVPARIWIEQPTDPDTGELWGDEVLCCDVGGTPRDPFDQWIWLCANPITEQEYQFRVADAEWCRAHQPQAPEANPLNAVRLRALPPLF